MGRNQPESQQAPTQPLYEVHDLGTFPGEQFSYAFGINEAGKVVGAASANFTSPAVRKRMGKSAAKGIIEAGTP